MPAGDATRALGHFVSAADAGSLDAFRSLAGASFGPGDLPPKAVAAWTRAAPDGLDFDAEDAPRLAPLGVVQKAASLSQRGSRF